MQSPTHQDLNQPPPRKPRNPFTVVVVLFVASWVMYLAMDPNGLASAFATAGPIIAVTLGVFLIGWFRFRRSQSPTVRTSARPGGSDGLVFAPGRSLSEGVLFTPVRLREGYDMGEVDQLLDRCDAAWLNNDGSMTAADVARSRFTPVVLREGYDMGEVDRHLERIEQAFRARETSGS